MDSFYSHCEYLPYKHAMYVNSSERMFWMFRRLHATCLVSHSSLVDQAEHVRSVQRTRNTLNDGCALCLL